MKCIGGVVLLVVTFIMLMSSSLGIVVGNTESSKFLRIHIRANSNSVIDQEIKYEIKDEVVSALIPVLANCTSKEEAINKVNLNFDLIEDVADNVLKNNGFNYFSTAKLTEEYFPIRSYNDTVLASGIYDALILELGEAEGNNWWCVVYPPLCFIGADATSGENFVYKSKLIEIINKFFDL